MRTNLLSLTLALSLSGCASLPHTPDGKLDVLTLLTWAQYGIDADCQFAKGALAADVCTFGGDAITAAKAAYAKDPATGLAAVKKILVDAETRKPTIAPYLTWVSDRL